MNRRVPVRRVMAFSAALLCFAGAGCPSDDDKSAADGGDAKQDSGASSEDSGSGGGKDKDAGNGGPKEDSGLAADSGADKPDVDAGTDAGSAEASNDEVVQGGEISGDGTFHVEYSNVEASNLIADDFDTTTPSGSSSVIDGKRSTSLSGTLSANGAQQVVTITVMGGIKPGATFDMIELPYNLSPGTGYFQLNQATFSPVESHIWRTIGEGKIKIEAVTEDGVKFSSEALPMAAASVAAPSNAGTGTFDATVSGQVLNINWDAE